MQVVGNGGFEGLFLQIGLDLLIIHRFHSTGDEAAVRYLLEKGADKTVKTKDGRTPLQVAIARSDLVLAVLILIPV